MFLIVDEYGVQLPCRTLRSAVCRMADISRADLKERWFRVTRWLVDTKSTVNYSVKHPASRLKGPVFVRSGA